MKGIPFSRRVTLLGCDTIPLVLREGEVWNVNYRPPRDVLKRLTRTFQIHPSRTWDKRERRWMRETRAPIVYVIRPRTKRERKLPDLPPGPYSSSFDYMMAVALEEGFAEIVLEGVTLSTGTRRERLAEHVSLAYWIGVARGRGVKVRIGRSCRILRAPYKYGLDYWREKRWGNQLTADVELIG